MHQTGFDFSQDGKNEKLKHYKSTNSCNFKQHWSIRMDKILE